MAYYAELNDGSGADRSCTVYDPKVGDVIDAYGMTWRVMRVDDASRYTYARRVQ